MSGSSLEVWVAAYFKQNPTTAHDEPQTTDCWPMDVAYRYHSVFFSAHTGSFQPRFHPYYCPWPPFSSSNTGSLMKFDLILQISVKVQKPTVGLRFCSGQTFHCVNSEDYIVFLFADTILCLFLLKYISTHQVQRLLHVPQLSRWNSFMRNSCLVPLKTSEINILLWV